MPARRRRSRGHFSLSCSPAALQPGQFAAVLSDARVRSHGPTTSPRERWYRPQLERLHDDAAPRAADVAHLVRLAAGYLSRERFLTELALDPPAAASDESGPGSLDEDYLILSTIHSAKGQEWSAVSVLNVVDGCIPSDMATGHAAEIEEERRLLYVAMTRARHHLHLLVPQRFYVTQQRPTAIAHSTRRSAAPAGVDPRSLRAIATGAALAAPRNRRFRRSRRSTSAPGCALRGAERAPKEKAAVPDGPVLPL